MELYRVQLVDTGEPAASYSELQHGDGAKLMVRLRGSEGLDLLALVYACQGSGYQSPSLTRRMAWSATRRPHRRS